MPAPSLERGSLQRMLLEPIFPALTVGAVSGATGLIGGGLGGLLFSQHPVLFAISAAIQCSGLGSTFWYVRHVGAQPSSSGSMPNRESLMRSTIAGSITGAVNGAFRSRSSILPGAFIFGMFGVLGQGAYNGWQRSAEAVETKVTWGQRILDSRWIPMRRLSDHDYTEMLGEKIIKVDTEIAIIDERIAALRKGEKGGD